MSGKLKLGVIPTLPNDWWEDPESVWSTWDRDTYYLWGANGGNYATRELGVIIGGGGLAGPNGPTRGRAHPNYVGVCTMSTKELPLNVAVFDLLREQLRNGSDVLVPTYRDKYSLGTGIGATTPRSPEKGHIAWRTIQRSILQHLVALGEEATAVEIPEATYWPDCTVLAAPDSARAGDEGTFALQTLDDLKALVSELEATNH